MSFFNGKKLAIIKKINKNDIDFVYHLSFLELACLFRHYKKQTRTKFNIFTSCFTCFPDLITFLVTFLIIFTDISIHISYRNKPFLYTYDCLFWLFIFLIYLLFIKIILISFLNNVESQQKEEILFIYMRKKYKIKEIKKLKKYIKSNQNENNKKRL